MTVLDIKIGLPGQGNTLQASDSKLSPVSQPFLQREEDGGACNIRCRILCPPLQDFEQEVHSSHSFQMQFSKDIREIICFLLLISLTYFKSIKEMFQKKEYISPFLS